MMTHASGTFEVKLSPQPADGYADGVALARMTIHKEFQGDLQATSKGIHVRLHYGSTDTVR